MIQVTWNIVSIAAVVGFVLSVILPHDATDPPDARSGMGLKTDHETGCQYLTNPRGGITPRVDVNNKHLGCK